MTYVMTEQESQEVDLLNKTMDWIEAHPDRHEQGSWAFFELDEPISADTDMDTDLLIKENFCNTAYCFAGTGLLLAGEAPDIHWQPIVVGTHNIIAIGASCMKSGESIEVRAEHLFGLSNTDAAVMFNPCNTRELLRLMTDRVTEYKQAGTYDKDTGIFDDYYRSGYDDSTLDDYYDFEE